MAMVHQVPERTAGHVQVLPHWLAQGPDGAVFYFSSLNIVVSQSFHTAKGLSIKQSWLLRCCFAGWSGRAGQVQVSGWFAGWPSGQVLLQRGRQSGACRVERMLQPLHLTCQRLLLCRSVP